MFYPSTYPWIQGSTSQPIQIRVQGTGFLPSTYPDKGSRYRVFPLNLTRYRVSDTGFFPSTNQIQGFRYRVLPLNLTRYRVSDTGFYPSTYPDTGFKIQG